VRVVACAGKYTTPPPLIERDLSVFFLSPNGTYIGTKPDFTSAWKLPWRRKPDLLPGRNFESQSTSLKNSALGFKEITPSCIFFTALSTGKV
jgi:hypothetical protein